MFTPSLQQSLRQNGMKGEILCAWPVTLSYCGQVRPSPQENVDCRLCDPLISIKPSFNGIYNNWRVQLQYLSRLLKELVSTQKNKWHQNSSLGAPFDRPFSKMVPQGSRFSSPFFWVSHILWKQGKELPTNNLDRLSEKSLFSARKQVTLFCYTD